MGQLTPDPLKLKAGRLPPGRWWRWWQHPDLCHWRESPTHVSSWIPQAQWWFEGICTNDGIGGILSTDIHQNSLACHPTGHPKHPTHWNYFNRHHPQNQQPCWGMAFQDEESHQQTSPKLTSLHGLNTSKQGRQWPSQDSVLQVWSYSLATDMLYEGEWEEDTDSLWPLQHRRHDSKRIPSSYQAPYWTLSTVFPKYLISFCKLILRVDFMKVDLPTVDFWKSCSCKNWSHGSWSHESWSCEQIKLLFNSGSNGFH